MRGCPPATQPPAGPSTQASHFVNVACITYRVKCLLSIHRSHVQPRGVIDTLLTDAESAVLPTRRQAGTRALPGRKLT